MCKKERQRKLGKLRTAEFSVECSVNFDIVRRSGVMSKKIKVECLRFQEKWMVDCVFMMHKSIPICLPYQVDLL